jgi:hypothetical protein
MTELQDIIDIADGNPGALEVMGRLLNKHRIQLTSLLPILQEHNIKGSDIWVIYKLCKKNLDQFVVYPFDTYTSKMCK